MIARAAVAALLAAVALLAAAPATAAERAYQLTGFTRLIVDGAYQVVVTTNKGVGARASGDPRALDRLAITQSGDTVRVRRVTTMTWEGNEDAGAPVIIRLSTPSLRSLTVSGASTVTTTAMRASAVDITSSGAPTIAVASVDADRLLLTQSGAGSLTLAGTARAATVTTSGAATLNAASLVADDLRLVAQGAGTATLTARRTARVDANGSGSVVVNGRADCVVKASGAGVVRCGHSKVNSQ